MLWSNNGERLGVAWITDDMIRNLYDSVYQRGVADFLKAANSPTINWFESSSDWVKIKDGTVDHVWKWRKE